MTVTGHYFYILAKIKMLLLEIVASISHLAGGVLIR